MQSVYQFSSCQRTNYRTTRENVSFMISSEDAPSSFSPYLGLVFFFTNAAFKLLVYSTRLSSKIRTTAPHMGCFSKSGIVVVRPGRKKPDSPDQTRLLSYNPTKQRNKKLCLAFLSFSCMLVAVTHYEYQKKSLNLEASSEMLCVV